MSVPQAPLDRHPLHSACSPVRAGGWGSWAGLFQSLGLAAALLALACSGGNSPSAGSLPPTGTTGIPAQGDASTLDIATWNVEWFGDSGYGPTDENLQQQNVRSVIAGADCDLWALEEVVSASAFSGLVAGLPGYAGLLSSDSLVVDGPAYYGATEQKVALLYKTSLARVLSAQLILTDHDYDFAGRPPMEVKLEITLNGSTGTLYVICLHAKAFNDAASWQRRFNASAALKAYLDTARSGDKVLVLGDFNDDLDASITVGQASPYQNFVLDTGGYATPTKALSDAGIPTTLSYADAIDHHLASAEWSSKYLSGSAKAFGANQYVLNYAATTTDHLPVITRWSAP